MESMPTLHVHCKIVTPTWKTNNCNGSNGTIFMSKTLMTKPSSKFLKPKPISRSSLCSSFHPSHPPHDNNNSTKHTSLLVETNHEHQRLKALLERLDKKDSYPLQVLEEDGDWTKDHFWAVIRFLKHASRFNEILPVFEMRKNMENHELVNSTMRKLYGC